MAVIVQADPYQGLIRKIGYSVGLEKLVERVKNVVSLYVKDRSLSFGAFRDLIEKDFGRKKATEHFANFYGTLNLLRIIGREVESLYQLDSLSILRRIFVSEEDKYDVALKVVLTQCIIEADGDVFLNGLLSDFRAYQLRRLLETMVQTKRRQLTGKNGLPHLLAKIYQVVDIKNQTKPESNSLQDASPHGRFARRTTPLDTFRRTSHLTPPPESAVLIPDDYLDKVSQTRKGWAQDLGLFHEGERTERAKHLLEILGKCVTTTDTKPAAALFWGYNSDLHSMHLKPQHIGAGDCEAWDLLSAISRAFTDTSFSSAGAPPDADEVVTILKRIYGLYRESNTSQQLIRNSLPLYVAEPVLAAWCVAEARQLPHLSALLRREYEKKTHRRVQKMLIRGTAGALFFTR